MDVEIRAQEEKSMAVCYILKSNENRYKQLLEDLKSSANHGRDKYPVTLTDAFNSLV